MGVIQTPSQHSDAKGEAPRRSAYGAGHFAKSLAWTFTDLLLAYYANVHVGLSAHQTGLLLFLSMAYGAGLDPAVAYFLRHAEGSRRRILQIQFVAGVLTAGALLVVFLPPVEGVGSFAYLLAALFFLRTAYAVYDVAQNALVSLLPANEADAHRYVILRQTLSAVARLCVAALSFLIISKTAPTGREAGLVAVIAVLIVATSGWILAWAGPASGGVERRSVPGLRLPRGAGRLLVAAAIHSGPFSMAARMVTFVQGAGADDHTGAALLFALVLGTLMGPIGLGRMRFEDGEFRAALVFTALAVFGGVGFAVAPRSGAPALAACLAYGVGLGGTMTLFWRGMSVAVREHALRTGVRTDLAAFALLTAVLKLASALFGGAVGLALDGFRAGAPATALALGALVTVGGVGFLALFAPRHFAPKLV